jgi:hypothetical protein
VLVFFAFLIVLTAAATGAAAYFQLFPHILIAAAACGFAILFGGVYAMKSSAAIVDQFAQSVEDKRTEFQEELKSVFTRHNEAYFTEFLKIFGPLRDRAEETRQRNEPHVMEVENLRKALLTIGAELDINIA